MVGFAIGALYLGQAGSGVRFQRLGAVILRALGLLWMLLALGLFLFLCYRADHEIALALAKGKADEVLNQRMFWYIILPIFTPIMAGLGLFGWYAWRGEYGRSDTGGH
jgi:hypothetical protein